MPGDWGLSSGVRDASINLCCLRLNPPTLPCLPCPAGTRSGRSSKPRHTAPCGAVHLFFFSENLNLKTPLRQQRRILILKIQIQGRHSRYFSITYRH